MCGHLFEKPYSCGFPEWSTRKYCSVKCKDNSPRSEETRLKQRLAKIGKPSWNKGIPMRTESKLKLSKVLMGRKLSEETKQKMLGRRPWNKIGDGITPINERIRRSPEYKNWRKKVFERDDYTCQECGKRGGNLHADHIKPFALHVELRFELSNGRTLCIPCHRKTKSYGINQWTYPQLRKISF